MFWNLFSKRILTMMRDKELLFWTWIFPLAMATLFYFCLGSINERDKLEQIPVAVEENQEYRENPAFSKVLEALEKEKLIKVSLVKEEKEAQSLLEEDRIEGYLKLEDGIPKLVIKENGIDQTILKNILDRYRQKETLIQAAAAQNPKALEDLSSFFDSQTFVKEVSISRNPASGLVMYFYALMAMTCMYGGFQGMACIIEMQGNLSSLGARRMLSPVKKTKLVCCDLFAGLVVSFSSLLVFACYLLFVLKINLGPSLFRALLLGLAGCFVGVAMGAMITALLKKKAGFSTGLIIGITLLCCYFAGLMTEGINYVMAEKAPVLHMLNPAARIAESLYSLYYYDTYEIYDQNLAILLTMGICMTGIAIWRMRRQRYECV